jgi:hypothetical protein
VQELAGLLTREFRGELDRADRKPANILPLPQQRSFWSDSRWGSVAVAALVAITVVIAAVLLSDGTVATRGKLAKGERVLQMEVLNLPPAAPDSASSYEADGGEDGFVRAASESISTVGLNVGKMSYHDIRRAIESGSMPPRDAVQIEELINSFSYDYPQPADDRALAIGADVVVCPWQPEHRLVRIAVNSRDGAANAVIARNARVHVEFNTDVVESYRLIGYERPRSQGTNADGEEIVAGHAVSALYEVKAIGAPAATASSSDRMLTVKVSFVAGSGDVEQVQHTVGTAVQEFADAPADLKLISAVAEFGMILRGRLPDRADFRSVLAHAEEGRGNDRSGDRAAFIELVRKAQALAGTRG